MSPDYTKQLQAIAEAVDRSDWITPITGILGVLVGLCIPFAIEIWKTKKEADLLIDAAYREAAQQFQEVVNLLHTYNINSGSSHVAFNRFSTSQAHYDKAINDPRLFSDTSLKALSSVHQYLTAFAALCEGRLAIGEEFAELARSCVFEIEDVIFRGGVEKRRFYKFLDTRLASRLLASKSTEEYWRSKSIPEGSE